MEKNEFTNTGILMIQYIYTLTMSLGRSHIAIIRPMWVQYLCYTEYLCLCVCTKART